MKIRANTGGQPALILGSQIVLVREITHSLTVHESALDEESWYEWRGAGPKLSSEFFADMASPPSLSATAQEPSSTTAHDKYAAGADPTESGGLDWSDRHSTIVP